MQRVCCKDCYRTYGDPYWIDVVMPNEQWEEISDFTEDIICGACIIRRIEVYARKEQSYVIPRINLHFSRKKDLDADANWLEKQIASAQENYEEWPDWMKRHYKEIHEQESEE